MMSIKITLTNLITLERAEWIVELKDNRCGAIARAERNKVQWARRNGFLSQGDEYKAETYWKW